MVSLYPWDQQPKTSATWEPSTQFVQDMLNSKGHCWRMFTAGMSFEIRRVNLFNANGYRVRVTRYERNAKGRLNEIIKEEFFADEEAAITAFQSDLPALW